MRDTLIPAPAAASRRRTLRSGHSAFTMIELLTVIAIIAILAAIIFPVFGTARESVRRGACISNMQKLSQAVKLYQLDNRRYPDYLYGPALLADGTIKSDTSPNAGLSMNQVANYVRATITPGTPAAEAGVIRNVQLAYRNSLFPEYINDLSVYKCPNNTEADTANTTAVGTAPKIVKGETDANGFTPNWAVRNRGFYKYDSYDANPTITSPTAVNAAQYQVRYNRVWEALLDRTQLDALAPQRQQEYQNQLVFRDPSSDTYLTMCTFHVPKGKVIVLWLNGNAKVLDVNKLNQARFAPSGGFGRDYDTYKMTPTNY
jgi:prepilin-type N-terminal cleavage/methylation domain-containing protein